MIVFMRSVIGFRSSVVFEGKKTHRILCVIELVGVLNIAEILLF